MQSEVLNLSGIQLKQVLDGMLPAAKENLENGITIIGFELMFEYEGGVHFVGVKYDKKAAKKAHVQGISSEYFSVYLDKERYPGTAELFANAKLGGISLNAISFGITVYRDEVEKYLPEPADE